MRVGRASSRERHRNEYLAKVREQHRALARLGSSYDDGWDGAAFLLAVTVRVLVHDTASSSSLLGLIGLKKRLDFVDTAAQPLPQNLLTHSGLAAHRLLPQGARWYPMLDAVPPPYQDRTTRFDHWWQTGVVIVDAAGVEWTRKRLVLTLANQEGGAHVDPRRSDDVRIIEDENSMGFVFVRDGREYPYLNSILGASVRQIAHEAQRTLELQVLNGNLDGLAE